MNFEPDASTTSMPSELNYEDIRQSKESEGSSWRKMRSSILPDESFCLSKVRESISDFKEKLSKGDSPRDLQNAFSDSNEFLRRKAGKSEDMQTLQLTKELISCKQQIQMFQETILEAHGIMKDLTGKWAFEKEKGEKLKEEIRSLGHKERIDEHIQTDLNVQDLQLSNQMLTEQIQRNVEVFHDLSETLAKNSHLEAVLVQKEKSIEKLTSEKQIVINVVDQLVGTARKILMNSNQKKREYLTEELMSSLKSVKFSDIQ